MSREKIWRQSKFGFLAVIHKGLLYKAIMRSQARGNGSRTMGLEVGEEPVTGLPGQGRLYQV